MEDEKQFMKYLSWLDDLDQDLVFNDIENVLTMKMDQHDLSGQPMVDSTLQYDSNAPNFDYSNRMMQYNANENDVTEAMNMTQPSVISDSFNYNNFLPNSAFYSDPSLSQQHVPIKPQEAPFCVDISHNVHADNNSFTNTSDPQLCIDITSDSSHLNVPQQSNQYALSNDVDIKENFFHEEKHLIENDFTNDQLSMNAIPHDVNISANNDFPQIANPNELYCSEISQESINIDHTPIHQNSFVEAMQNLNDVSNTSLLETPIEIHNDFEEAIKAECQSDVKEELKSENFNEEPQQNQVITAAPIESSQEIVQNETVQTIKDDKENTKDAENAPITNGVDNIKIKTENECYNMQMCIRNGCANRAINNPEWEQEFCSNDCVILHCRNVFTAWVKANEINSS